jgi:hypothetical protein
LAIWLSLEEAAALPDVSAEGAQPTVAIVPATNPAMAAERINVLAVNFIIIPGLIVSIISILNSQSGTAELH